MNKYLTSNQTGFQIFFAFNILAGIIGLWYYGISLESLILIAVGYTLYGCFGQVVAFHRLLSHKSFQTTKTIENIFSFFGCLAGTGSSIGWVSNHTNHHLNSDKDTDPHSPHHKGLKVFLIQYEVDPATESECGPRCGCYTKWRIKDLFTEGFHKFLHRNYFALIILWSMFLTMIGGIYLALFLYWIPAGLIQFMSGVVNYVGHNSAVIGSYRSYNTPDRSVNNWWLALLTFGEGWHNNHHRHPKKYTNREKFWEIDPAGWVISVIRTKT